MNDADAMPGLDLAGGELVVRGWPATQPPPFGLRRDGALLRGPARLRAAVRRGFAHAGLPFRDVLAQPPLPTLPPPPLLRTEASLLAIWRLGGHQGLTAGLPFDSRVHLVLGAITERCQRALVVTVDTGATHLWQRELGMAGLLAHADVVTAADAARCMPPLARRHDVLAVDAPELMPWPTLEAVLDGSAASSRLGFASRADARGLLRWSRGLGPLLGIVDTSTPPRTVELRVPLPQRTAEAHATAWHKFLAAFDRFAALQPNAGFGTFVQQAREDPEQRPALLAWHEALHLASWHAHKALLIADLLQRHRGERILVFTPDRASAYELARSHLIAPITAELPRTERLSTVDQFLDGTLRVLAGPRLLDLGVPEQFADVGILVGGGYGRDQRAARCRRVAPQGVIYELVSNDTVEVGRAHRWRGSTANSTAVFQPDRG
ncbi:MAG: hypothetical protein KA020_06670 [Planctomycetes bacterium]|nr:hypothetical protein [Planctomycetota bacterium]